MVPYAELYVGFLLAVQTLETYLDIRQHRRFRETTVPPALKDIVEHDEFVKAQAYSLDKSSFGLFMSFWSLAKLLAILYFGILPLFWSVSGSLLDKYFGLGAEYEITQSLLFVFLYSLAETIIGIPTDVYSTFVLEARHGFNKQTVRLFITDHLQGLMLGIVIGGALLGPILHLIEWGGEHFYLYVFGFVVVFQVIMMQLYPTLIQPLFNKVEPLEDGSLKKSVDELAAKINFPLTKVYVIDGSKRSSHSNAYFDGFFKNKRIVLYDTLVAQLSESEVVAVLAHELGHWKLSHTLKNFIVVELNLFASLYLFSLFMNDGDLYTSFGFDTQPRIIGLLLFQFVYSPVGHVLGLALNFVSRAFEFQADAFARRLGYASLLRLGLVKLQKENKGVMTPDRLYSAYHYSHPPLVERLAALDKQD